MFYYFLKMKKMYTTKKQVIINSVLKDRVVMVIVLYFIM